MNALLAAALNLETRLRYTPASATELCHVHAIGLQHGRCTECLADEMLIEVLDTLKEGSQPDERTRLAE